MHGCLIRIINHLLWCVVLSILCNSFVVGGIFFFLPYVYVIVYFIIHKEEGKIVLKNLLPIFLFVGMFLIGSLFAYCYNNYHKRKESVIEEKSVKEYCKKHNILMTIRLGESKDELDWLDHGFSDIDLLNEFTGHKKFEPAVTGLSPAKYLEEMGILSKQLLISYGNYLSDSDLEILNKNKVSLAYCPRISDNLHNQKLSLDKVLEFFPNRFGFGVNSLAFNSDLSLLNELKYVNNGVLNVIDAIKYLTIIPAKILRLNNIIGSLETDKDADFNVFELNENEDYNSILNKEKPNHVYIKGKRVVKRGELNIKN